MIILTGYNGTPKGVLNCNEGGCKRCNDKNKRSGLLNNCICVHAEQNIITLAAREGISTNNCILYCTNKPCNECLKLLINAGIKEVYYLLDYNTIPNMELLKKIKLRKIKL